MELLIVRHAIACERDPQRWPDDRDRPLSPRGVLRARQAAAGVKTRVPRPSRVLTSPLQRAVQTAAILTQFAGWPRAGSCAQLEPGVAAEALLSFLARVRERRVALIGHEPDLGTLIASCVGTRGSAFELRKMGMALIAFPAAPRAGRGALLWLLPPKILRAAR